MKLTKINKTSAESVKKATGKNWDQWVAIIDRFGGKKMSHKEIAAKLYNDKLIKSGWWCQMVTVGYEYAKGRRVVGQTLSVGFEIGVQKMVHLPKKKVWQIINSSAGKKIWQGKAKVELRTKKEEERMRLRFIPPGRKQPTVLQIYLSCPRNEMNKTTVGFHHEKLSGLAERNKMRRHWQKVLVKLFKWN